MPTQKIKEDIKTKLNTVLNRFGMNPLNWIDKVGGFRQKLELLSSSDRYNKLLKSLFSSNELGEFNSYVFEVLFAYDFESKSHILLYEVRQSTEENTSVDFCYNLDDQKKVYFELRLINQRHRITKLIEWQLKTRKYSEISLNGQDDIKETIRLQNLILSKCQNDNGKPIKFCKVTEGIYNIIVVNASGTYLNMIDRDDCIVTMYGSDSSPIFYHGLNIFGLCQQLGQDASNDEKKYYHKFQYFRETIHGVLFVKFAQNDAIILDNRMHLDGELEYFLIGNENLWQQQNCNLVAEKLGSFLKKWSAKRNKNEP